MQKKYRKDTKIYYIKFQKINFMRNIQKYIIYYFKKC